MKSTLVLSVCAALPLMVSVAYGQSANSSPSSPPPTPPATTPGMGAGGTSGTMSGSGATTTTPGATMPAPGATTAAPGATGANPYASQPVSGQSVKSEMMGESVYNENGDKIGDVKDVVLDADGKASNVIIGAGGFLGMGEHDVAVPFSSMSRSKDKLILSGYTKDQLKALPSAKVTK